MSQRKPVRTAFFAVSAAAALLAGPVLLTAPMATAAPSPEYPLGGEGDGGAGTENKPEDDAGERAERAGGGLASEVIDLGADLLKCGLSIATEAVSCPLGT
ncbi:hypothetical protein [Nocardia sp. NPDC024068]|uniref:hypothetical protein n=1 Tax=Nocardia sp. NPDC024068 TaxID=3157197 RepID=UPI0033D66094